MFYCENIVEQKNKKSEKLTCLLLEKKHHIKKIDKYIYIVHSCASSFLVCYISSSLFGRGVEGGVTGS